LGTPQELTDMNGEIAWAAEYKAWGYAYDALSKAGRQAGLKQPLRFQGQYYDHETGLHYNRHRYYDPHSGRFVSKDPIGLKGGWNMHEFAPNPVAWVDPLGLAKIYGNWCGPNWTGGYKKPWDKLSPYEQRETRLDPERAPKDRLDACCETHDKCHASCRAQYPCDDGMQESCMKICDYTLAACDRNSGIKGPRALAIEVVMDHVTKPEAEIPKSCNLPDGFSAKDWRMNR
jgi:RHS repeat-associated protein